LSYPGSTASLCPNPRFEILFLRVYIILVEIRVKLNLGSLDDLTPHNLCIKEANVYN
jgi:hypothetical protein